MNLKIKKLHIFSKNGEESAYDFADSLMFIYGNIGAGKTTLLNLIMYCLGREMLKTPAVIAYLEAVQLEVTLNGHLCRFFRKADSIWKSIFYAASYLVGYQVMQDYLTQGGHDAARLNEFLMLPLRNYIQYTFVIRLYTDRITHITDIAGIVYALIIKTEILHKEDIFLYAFLWRRISCEGGRTVERMQRR